MDTVTLSRLDDLTVEEVRVLGCLIEKETTVPDSYPLTLNALVHACNQTTSRQPIVSYGDEVVEQAIESLRAKGLARTVHMPASRVDKYRHVVAEAYRLDPAEMAILCVLMLRGPQTVGELKSRTDRQHEFHTLDEVEAVLQGLSRRALPLVHQAELRPGQKDARWEHLLTGDPGGPGRGAAGASGRKVLRTDCGDVDDLYGVATAEFYELLATAHWERTGMELMELLDGVDPSDGPIVDVGVGTGIGVPYILAAVPEAEVYAIEPSKAMRTALHTRLSLDLALARRVTVDPRPLADALPSRASAMVLSAVLGHLDDDDRTALWRFVVERMQPGAPVIVELLPPHRPVEIEPTRYAARPIGRFTYEGWQSGEPVDEHTMKWTMTYRVLEDKTLIASHEATSEYRCWSPEELAEEVAAYDLKLTRHDDAVVIRR